ncbi:MAG: hypothetical protein OEL89_01200 [Candidatus Peregrinibacteria bacterium]|nr:hypothetical protein [Candidatus Peregrinibacteria bacterium]
MIKSELGFYDIDNVLNVLRVRRSELFVVSTVATTFFFIFTFNFDFFRRRRKRRGGGRERGRGGRRRRRAMDEEGVGDKRRHVGESRKRSTVFVREETSDVFFGFLGFRRSDGEEEFAVRIHTILRREGAIGVRAFFDSGEDGGPGGARITIVRISVFVESDPSFESEKRAETMIRIFFNLKTEEEVEKRVGDVLGVGEEILDERRSETTKRVRREVIWGKRNGITETRTDNTGNSDIAEGRQFVE